MEIKKVPKGIKWAYKKYTKTSKTKLQVPVLNAHRKIDSDNCTAAVITEIKHKYHIFMDVSRKVNKKVCEQRIKKKIKDKSKQAIN